MENRKLLCLGVCLLFLPLSLFSLEQGKWYVGASGDYVYNMMVSSTGYRTNTSYENGHGFAVSVPVLYQFTSWLGIETGVRYVQKNYGWKHVKEIESGYSYTDYQNVQNHFLEIPITVDFTFGDGIVQSVTAIGGYLGFWMLSHRSGAYIDTSAVYPVTDETLMIPFDENVEFDTNRDNRFEAGLLVRTGFLVKIDPILLSLRGSFSLGLTDLNKQYQKQLVGRFNDSVTVEAGILIGFGGTK